MQLIQLQILYKFLEYLTGIETSMQLIQLQILYNLFLEYLTGIETIMRLEV